MIMSILFFWYLDAVEISEFIDSDCGETKRRMLIVSTFETALPTLGPQLIFPNFIATTHSERKINCKKIIFDTDPRNVFFQYFEFWYFQEKTNRNKKSHIQSYSRSEIPVVVRIVFFLSKKSTLFQHVALKVKSIHTDILSLYRYAKSRSIFPLQLSFPYINDYKIHASTIT